MFYYLFDVTHHQQEYRQDYGAIPNGDVDDEDDEEDPSLVSSTLTTSTTTTVTITRRMSVDNAIRTFVGFRWSSLHGRLFIATALLFLVDSMELSILAFLSRALDERVEWFHEQYVAYAGIGGSLFGAMIWGSLADIVGRKTVTLWVSSIVTMFGMVTALLVTLTTTQQQDNPNNIIMETPVSDTVVMEGLLISRFLVGFGLGGVSVPYDLFAEWLPNQTSSSNNNNNNNNLQDQPRRAPYLLLVKAFWSIGSLLIYALLQTQTFLSPQKGQLTGIELWWCNVPAVLATLVLVTGGRGRGGHGGGGGGSGGTRTAILESPRFLLAQGRHDEALHVIQWAAAQAHGIELHQVFPESTRIILYSKESQIIPTTATTSSPSGRRRPWAAIYSLLSWQWLNLASSLLLTYFGQAFCYQGTAAMLISVFDEHNHGQQYQAGLSAVSELVGIALLMGIVDSWGRVPTQIAAYGLTSLSCLTLAVWFSLPFLENGNVLICLSLIARMLVNGGGAVTWVSTTEVFSTEIRTTGHAIAGMAGRLGAFAATLAFDKFEDIPLLALIIFAVSFWVAFAAEAIPETRLKEMGRNYIMLGHSKPWHWRSNRRG